MQILELKGEILNTSFKKILAYECQYIDETMLDNRFAYFCEGCDFITNEPDINCSTCPADFDWKSSLCMKGAEWLYVKRYLMYADLLLRNTLGDIWNDEYSA